MFLFQKYALDEGVLDSKRICWEETVDTAELEGANSGGLKTKLSDIIILAGLALIGPEDNIDIKHVS